MKRASAYLLFLLLVLSLILAGCGGENQSTPALDVPFSSGLNQIRATDPNGTTTFFTLGGNLTKSGRSVSGVMHISLPSCFPFSTDIPVTGVLGGDAPDFQINLSMMLPSGQTLAFSLTHPGGQVENLGGTFTITGAGCAGPAQGFASVNALSLTGAWHGTMTSSGGTTSQMSLALTQTGPDANGFFSGTGIATITGGTCFSTATVDPSSVLIGAGSTLVLDGPAGSGGQTILQGDFSPPVFGTSVFNGTYTSTQGACSDSGTVNMQFP